MDLQHNRTALGLLRDECLPRQPELETVGGEEHRLSHLGEQTQVQPLRWLPRITQILDADVPGSQARFSGDMEEHRQPLRSLGINPWRGEPGDQTAASTQHLDDRDFTVGTGVFEFKGSQKCAPGIHETKVVNPW